MRNHPWCEKAFSVVNPQVLQLYGQSCKGTSGSIIQKQHELNYSSRAAVSLALCTSVPCACLEILKLQITWPLGGSGKTCCEQISRKYLHIQNLWSIINIHLELCFYHLTHIK